MTEYGSTQPDLVSEARIVIIGGGIVGCSTAYHLALNGVHDVVLVEQGPLFRTGGSTSHASNFIYEIDHSETMTKCTAYSARLYRELQSNGRSCYNIVGGLEVARTYERLRELERKVTAGKSWGVEAHMVSPKQAKELLPFLNEKLIVGAMYSPSAGVVESVPACEAMGRFAEERGARLYPHTTVTDMVVEHGRATAVVTDRGTIKAETIVVCAGVWGPKVAAMAGVRLPIHPLHHQLTFTEPLPEFAGAAEGEVNYPLFRDQDKAMYGRQDGTCWQIGNYQQRSLLTDPDEIPRYGESPRLPTEFPFTEEDFTGPYRDHLEIIPFVKGRALRDKFNGLLSVATDGRPVVGESPEVRGLWFGEAVWIKEAGGVGKMLAEWIAHGEPEMDPYELDIARFHPHQVTPTYVQGRSSEGFQKIYGIVHPHEQWRASRNVRLTPFHSRWEALGATFFETAGWERPQWFEDNMDLLPISRWGWPAGFRRDGWEAMWWSPVIGAEHLHVREHVGLFELSAFQKIEVSGPGALDFLQRLAVRQMDRPVGRVVYTPLLTERGGIKADLTMTRLADDRFLVVTGGAMGIHDRTWIRRHMPDDGSVHIQDVTSSLCCLGVWGPKARDVVQAVTDNEMSNEAFPFGSARRITIGPVPVLAMRISYVGELGWELYAPMEQGPALWDLLWEAGQAFALRPIGMGAFDSLRVEKGYRHWGAELRTAFNPYEAGIAPARLKPQPFIGREALERIRDAGTSRRLCCMTFDDERAIALGREPILKGDEVLGFVTSANYGYSVGRAIAYGYLPNEYAEIGTQLDIEYLGKRHAVTVARDPQYDPDHAKLKA